MVREEYHKQKTIQKVKAWSWRIIQHAESEPQNMNERSYPTKFENLTF